MIEISEKLIHQAIKEGLTVLREDEKLFNRVFHRLNVTEASKLKKYIQENKVNVTQGYPTNRAKLPAYAIMLGGENAEQGYLGDMAEELSPEVSTELGLERSENIIEERVRVRKRGEAIELTTSKRNILGVTYIQDDAGEPVDLNGLEIEDAQRGTVLLYGTHLVNAQEVDISYYYDALAYTSFGSIFNKSYRIEVWAPNADLVVHLYHLLKWILLVAKNKFHANGWHNIQLGGADLEPMPEFEQELVFRRAVSLSFSVEETFELDYGYIQDITVKYYKEDDWR